MNIPPSPFVMTLLSVDRPLSRSPRKQTIVQVRLEEGVFKIGSTGEFVFENQSVPFIIKGIGILKQSVSEIAKRQKDNFTLLVETPGFNLATLGVGKKLEVTITIKGTGNSA